MSLQMQLSCVIMQSMSIKPILEKLKKSGARMTRTRIAIIEILSDSTTPLSANSLIIRLQAKGHVVNKTTVYREIDFLLDHTVISKVLIGGKSTLYELAGHHHHHLVCRSCSHIEHIDVTESWQSKEMTEIQHKTGFQITDHILEFFGICKKCK